jgi:hypothetical protein
VSLDTWQNVQATGAQRGNIQDEETITTHRGRCTSSSPGSAAAPASGGWSAPPAPPPPPATRPYYVYYRCPHNPRHTAAAPDHPKTVIVREDTLLDAITTELFTKRAFGPDRAALLAAELPASAAEETSRREKETARLRAQLKKIENAQASQITELEATEGKPTPALQAYRARLRARFVTAEEQRATITAELDALTAAAPPIHDPGLLDKLPKLSAGLLAQAPQKLTAGLLDAFDVQAVYHHKDNQVTIRAVLTEDTPPRHRRPPHPQHPAHHPTRPRPPHHHPASTGHHTNRGRLLPLTTPHSNYSNVTPTELGRGAAAGRMRQVA